MASFEFEHECGFKTNRAQAYAMHAKHCNGTGTPRSGRIAARDKALVPVTRHAGGRPRKTVAVDRTPPAIGTGAIVAAATDKAIEIVIAGLVAKRTAIDNAIAALQAVS
jgi:hypothetical protein